MAGVVVGVHDAAEHDEAGVAGVAFGQACARLDVARIEAEPGARERVLEGAETPGRHVLHDEYVHFPAPRRPAPQYIDPIYRPFISTRYIDLGGGAASYRNVNRIDRMRKPVPVPGPATNEGIPMFNGLIEAWRRWRRAISTKRELFALNEAQLRDIGIARTDIDRISRRTLPEYWT